MPPIYLLLLAAVVALGSSGCFGRLARYADEQPSQPTSRATGFEPERGSITEDRLAGFILATNPFLSPSDARLQAEAISRHARTHGVPVHLVASLIATESSFNPRAVSPVGAQGLGQLMPATAKDMGVTDPFDPEQNIGGTTRYVAWLAKVWQEHPQRWELVLASYLAGVGTVTRQLKAGQPLTGEQGAYVDKIFRLSGKV
jgi:soluble lytic murein transglycosylase-like protein